MSLIYYATNRITKITYVGKTEKTLEMRIKLHQSSVQKGAATYFHRAIRKYGMKSFDWRVVCRCDTKYLNFVEKVFIKYITENYIILLKVGMGGGTRKIC